MWDHPTSDVGNGKWRIIGPKAMKLWRFALLFIWDYYCSWGKSLHSVMSHMNVTDDMLKQMGKRSQLLRNVVVGTMPAMAL